MNEEQLKNLWIQLGYRDNGVSLEDFSRDIGYKSVQDRVFNKAKENGLYNDKNAFNEDLGIEGQSEPQAPPTKNPAAPMGGGGRNRFNTSDQPVTAPPGGMGHKGREYYDQQAVEQPLSETQDNTVNPLEEELPQIVQDEQKEGLETWGEQQARVEATQQINENSSVPEIAEAFHTGDVMVEIPDVADPSDESLENINEWRSIGSNQAKYQQIVEEAEEIYDDYLEDAPIAVRNAMDSPLVAKSRYIKEKVLERIKEDKEFADKAVAALNIPGTPEERMKAGVYGYTGEFDKKVEMLGGDAMARGKIEDQGWRIYASFAKRVIESATNQMSEEEKELLNTYSNALKAKNFELVSQLIKDNKAFFTSHRARQYVRGVQALNEAGSGLDKMKETNPEYVEYKDAQTNRQLFVDAQNANSGWGANALRYTGRTLLNWTGRMQKMIGALEHTVGLGYYGAEISGRGERNIDRAFRGSNIDGGMPYFWYKDVVIDGKPLRAVVDGDEVISVTDENNRAVTSLDPSFLDRVQEKADSVEAQQGINWRAGTSQMLDVGLDMIPILVITRGAGVGGSALGVSSSLSANVGTVLGGTLLEYSHMREEFIMNPNMPSGSAQWRALGTSLMIGALELGNPIERHIAMGHTSRITKKYAEALLTGTMSTRQYYAFVAKDLLKYSTVSGLKETLLEEIPQDFAEIVGKGYADSEFGTAGGGFNESYSLDDAINTAIVSFGFSFLMGGGSRVGRFRQTGKKKFSETTSEYIGESIMGKSYVREVIGYLLDNPDKMDGFLKGVNEGVEVQKESENKEKSRAIFERTRNNWERIKEYAPLIEGLSSKRRAAVVEHILLMTESENNAADSELSPEVATLYQGKVELHHGAIIEIIEEQRREDAGEPASEEERAKNKASTVENFKKAAEDLGVEVEMDNEGESKPSNTQKFEGVIVTIDGEAGVIQKVNTDKDGNIVSYEVRSAETNQTTTYRVEDADPQIVGTELRATHAENSELEAMESRMNSNIYGVIDNESGNRGELKEARRDENGNVTEIVVSYTTASGEKVLLTYKNESENKGEDFSNSKIEFGYVVPLDSDVTPPESRVRVDEADIPESPLPPDAPAAPDDAAAIRAERDQVQAELATAEKVEKMSDEARQKADALRADRDAKKAEIQAEIDEINRQLEEAERAEENVDVDEDSNVLGYSPQEIESMRQRLDDLNKRLEQVDNEYIDNVNKLANEDIKTTEDAAAPEEADSTPEATTETEARRRTPDEPGEPKEQAAQRREARTRDAESEEDTGEVRAEEQVEDTPELQKIETSRKKALDKLEDLHKKVNIKNYEEKVKTLNERFDNERKSEVTRSQNAEIQQEIDDKEADLKEIEKQEKDLGLDLSETKVDLQAEIAELKSELAGKQVDRSEQKATSKAGSDVLNKKESTTDESRYPTEKNYKKNSFFQKLRDKFKKGIHLFGKSDTWTLEDGQQVKGKWRLVDKNDVSPSHNAQTFKKNEGVPVNEKGEAFNDNDYEGQESKRSLIFKMTQAGIDGRALQNPIFVDENGVVKSGNRRTIANQRVNAEKRKAYLDDLRSKARDYGYTEAQVNEFIDKVGADNAMLVFEIEGAPVYTTAEYARYNINPSAQKSSSEVAANLSKTISKEDQRAIAAFFDVEGRSDINTLNVQETADLLNLLEKRGLIPASDKARYTNDSGRLSGAGADLVSALVLGAVFDTQTISKLQGIKSVMNLLVGLGSKLIANAAKGDQSISPAITEAIDLINEAETTHKTGSRIEKVAHVLASIDMLAPEASYSPAAALLSLMLGNKDRMSRLLDGANKFSPPVNLFGDQISTLDRINHILENQEDGKKELTKEESDLVKLAHEAIKFKQGDGDVDSSERRTRPDTEGKKTGEKDAKKPEPQVKKEVPKKKTKPKTKKKAEPKTKKDKAKQKLEQLEAEHRKRQAEIDDKLEAIQKQLEEAKKKQEKPDNTVGFTPEKEGSNYQTEGGLNETQADALMKKEGLSYGETYTVNDLVAKYKPRGAAKYVWRLIEQVVGQLGVEVVFTTDGRELNGHPAAYDYMNGKVYVHPGMIKSGLIARALVHEAAHAVTVKVIAIHAFGDSKGLTKRQINAANGLLRLFNSVRNDPFFKKNDRRKYMVSSIYEFIAHLSDPEMGEFLRSKDKNVVEKIIGWIAGILNIKNANDLALSFLADLVSSSQYVAETGGIGVDIRTPSGVRKTIGMSKEMSDIEKLEQQLIDLMEMREKANIDFEKQKSALLNQINQEDGGERDTSERRPSEPTSGDRGVEGQQKETRTSQTKTGDTTTQKEGRRQAVMHPDRPQVAVFADPPVPPDHMSQDYALGEDQALGVNAALERFFNDGRGFLLADGTGVGKTRQIIVVAEEYKKQTGEDVLIITQNKQIINDNFAKDADALGIDLSQFDIDTYHGLGKGKYSGKKYGLVIYDEAHGLKNASTAKSTAALNLDVDHEMFVTATPMETRENIVYFGGKISGLTEGAIFDKLGLQVRETVDEKTGEKSRVVIPDPNLSLKDIMNRLINMRKEMVEDGGMIRREFPFFGKVVTDLMQLSTDQSLVEAEIDLYWRQKQQSATRRQKMTMGKRRMDELMRWEENEKIPYVLSQAEKAIKNGRKVVIISEGVNATQSEALGVELPGFATEMTRLLEEKGYKVSKIYGSNNKDVEAAKFQNGETDVVVGSSMSASTGIDLDDQGGNAPRSLFIVTSSYSGSVFEQTLGRVSRRFTQSPSEVSIISYNAISGNRRKEIVDNKLGVLNALARGKVDEKLDIDWLDTPQESSPGGAYAGGEVQLVPYSKKSFAVFGDTKPIKDALRFLGGKFNPRLTNPKTKEREAGWIFSNRHKQDVIESLNLKEDSGGEVLGFAPNAIEGDSDAMPLFDRGMQSEFSPLAQMASEFGDIIGQSDKDAVLEWTNNAEWNDNVADIFVSNFKTFAYNGRAPSPELRAVFADFQNRVSYAAEAAIDSYGSIYQINDDVRNVYIQNRSLNQGLDNFRPIDVVRGITDKFGNLNIDIVDVVAKDIAEKTGISYTKVREMNATKQALSLPQNSPFWRESTMNSNIYNETPKAVPQENVVLGFSPNSTEAQLDKYFEGVEIEDRNVALKALTTIPGFVEGFQADIGSAEVNPELRAMVNKNQAKLAQLFKDKKGNTPEAESLKNILKDLKNKIKSAEKITFQGSSSDVAQLIADRLAELNNEIRNTEKHYVQRLSPKWAAHMVYVEREQNYNEKQAQAMEIILEQSKLPESERSQVYRDGLEAQKENQKKNLIRNVDYLYGNPDYSPAFQLLFIDSALKYMYKKGQLSYRDETTVTPHNEFNPIVLGEVKSVLKKDPERNLIEVYAENRNIGFLQESEKREIIGKYIVEERPEGVWIKIPQNADFDTIYDMQMIARESAKSDDIGSPWCTGELGTAETHNKMGDFYFFIDSDSNVRLGVRYNGTTEIAEPPRGLASGQGVESSMNAEVGYFLDNYPGGVKYKKHTDFQRIYITYIKNGKKLEGPDALRLMEIKNAGDGSRDGAGNAKKIKQMHQLIKDNHIAIAEALVEQGVVENANQVSFDSEVDSKKLKNFRYFINPVTIINKGARDINIDGSYTFASDVTIKEDGSGKTLMDMGSKLLGRRKKANKVLIGRDVKFFGTLVLSGFNGTEFDIKRNAFGMRDSYMRVDSSTISGEGLNQLANNLSPKEFEIFRSEIVGDINLSSRLSVLSKLEIFDSKINGNVNIEPHIEAPNLKVSLRDIQFQSKKGNTINVADNVTLGTVRMANVNNLRSVNVGSNNSINSFLVTERELPAEARIPVGINIGANNNFSGFDVFDPYSENRRVSISAGNNNKFGFISAKASHLDFRVGDDTKVARFSTISGDNINFIQFGNNAGFDSHIYISGKERIKSIKFGDNSYFAYNVGINAPIAGAGTAVEFGKKATFKRSLITPANGKMSVKIGEESKVNYVDVTTANTAELSLDIGANSSIASTINVRYDEVREIGKKPPKTRTKGININIGDGLQHSGSSLSLISVEGASVNKINIGENAHIETGRLVWLKNSDVRELKVGKTNDIKRAQITVKKSHVGEIDVKNNGHKGSDSKVRLDGEESTFGSIKIEQVSDFKVYDSTVLGDVYVGNISGTSAEIVMTKINGKLSLPQKLNKDKVKLHSGLMEVETLDLSPKIEPSYNTIGFPKSNESDGKVRETKITLTDGRVDDISYRQPTLFDNDETSMFDQVSIEDKGHPDNFMATRALWAKKEKFDFTGTTRVTSGADVAYIMRVLEDSAVEHAFVVHVDQDGKPHIQYISSGGLSQTSFEENLVMHGIVRYNSKKVYLVHNHPSGNMKPSDADKRLTNRVNLMINNYDPNIELEHIVMDTYKKEYVSMTYKEGDSDPSHVVKNRPLASPEDVVLRAESLDKIEALTDLSKMPLIKDARDLSEFIYSLRFSALPKHGMLILDRKLQVIGNYILQNGIDINEIMQEVVRYGLFSGIILYSNRSTYKTNHASIHSMNKLSNIMRSAGFSVHTHEILSSNNFNVKEAGPSENLNASDIAEVYGTDKKRLTTEDRVKEAMFVENFKYETERKEALDRILQDNNRSDAIKSMFASSDPEQRARKEGLWITKPEKIVDSDDAIRLIDRFNTLFPENKKQIAGITSSDRADADFSIATTQEQVDGEKVSKNRLKEIMENSGWLEIGDGVFDNGDTILTNVEVKETEDSVVVTDAEIYDKDSPVLGFPIGEDTGVGAKKQGDKITYANAAIRAAVHLRGETPKITLKILQNDAPHSLLVESFAHLYVDMLNMQNTELYHRGLKLVEKTPYYKQYGSLDKALKMALSDRSLEISRRGVKRRIFNWTKSLWDKIADRLELNIPGDKLRKMTLGQFLDVAGTHLVERNKLFEAAHEDVIKSSKATSLVMVEAEAEPAIKVPEVTKEDVEKTPESVVEPEALQEEVPSEEVPQEEVPAEEETPSEEAPQEEVAQKEEASTEEETRKKHTEISDDTKSALDEWSDFLGFRKSDTPEPKPRPRAQESSRILAQSPEARSTPRIANKQGIEMARGMFSNSANRVLDTIEDFTNSLRGHGYRIQLHNSASSYGVANGAFNAVETMAHLNGNSLHVNLASPYINAKRFVEDGLYPILNELTDVKDLAALIANSPQAMRNYDANPSDNIFALADRNMTDKLYSELKSSIDKSAGKLGNLVDTKIKMADYLASIPAYKAAVSLELVENSRYSVETLADALDNNRSDIVSRLEKSSFVKKDC